MMTPDDIAPSDVLYDKPEVARRLGGVTTKFVEREIMRGRLGSVKVGRLRMIRADQLARYIADNSIDPR